MAKIQSLNSVPGKETIYIDVDDEITAIIDKVANAKGKVVALVLPKRAAVLQSVVNMKLLKRTADSTSKNLVLVTTESGLMPLAGAVGLHVASTPSSKPSIPSAPAGLDDEPENVDESLDIVDSTTDETDEFDPAVAGSKSVGELAAAGAAGKIAADDVDESIDMNDDEGGAEVAAAPKVKPNKKLRIPNFNSFRKKMALAAVVAVLLVVGLVFALTVLPHATITIHTDSSTITTNLDLTLDTAAKTLDTANNTVPATAQSQQKTSTQQVPATGQQNNGQKASGTVTVTNCSGDTYTLKTGTSMSSSGHTFIVSNGVVIPDSTYSSPISGSKCHNDSHQTVNVTALKGGSDYNLSAGSYTISGAPNGITAQGSAMTGGTDAITKIVTQTDIDGATTKITSVDSNSVKQQLVSGLQTKGLQPIQTTFVAGTPQVTTNAKAGDTADNVTVTAVTTYTMLGLKKADLKTLVDNKVTGQLDKGKQVILDDGVANADFTSPTPATATGASVSMETKSLAGPDINIAQLKTQLAGKKSGDIKSLVKQTPGVTDVEVHFSPFWVNSVPGKAAKVQIDIVKAGN